MTSGDSATSSAAILRDARIGGAGPDVRAHIAAFDPAQLLQPLSQSGAAGACYRIVGSLFISAPMRRRHESHPL